MVTFFRASPSPVRVTRAAKPPRRRQPKKTNDLPHPNKLPGIFGKKDLCGASSSPHAAAVIKGPSVSTLPCQKSQFWPQGKRRTELWVFRLGAVCSSGGAVGLGWMPSRQWYFMGVWGYLNIGLFASLPLALKPPWEGITPGGCHGPRRVSQPQEGVTAPGSHSGRRGAGRPSSPEPI